MIISIVLISLLHPLVTSVPERYSQQRELLPGGELSLAWGVEGGRLHFKLVAAGSKSVDGMIVGHSEDGAQVVRDLHLDFAGILISWTFNVNK